MTTRPNDLDPLFRSVSVLEGIGPKLAKMLQKLLPSVRADQEARVLDLLFHMPSGLVDRRHQPGIANAFPGQIVTLKVTIDEHRPPPRGNRRAPYKIAVHDATGNLTLIFFHSHGDYLAKQFPPGETRYVSGRIEDFGGMPQMTHPDYIVTETAFQDLPLIEPIYPLTAGLSPKTLGRAVRSALSFVPVDPAWPEWIDPSVMRLRSFPPFGAALSAIHCPLDAAVLERESLAFQRLAYDELLAGQLALGLVRLKIRKTRGIVRKGDGVLCQRIAAALKFQLTASQQTAITEIAEDLASPERMVRLLQGDVGAGKTIVGLMAMATACEAGFQSALMAPTEILARQHLATIRPLAEAAGIRAEILTGREKGAERRAILEALLSGDIDILIGTHALFQESVRFSSLGLVIIDEQHRFGVHQRLALTQKGDATDLLVMTATPIPRTLVLTYFGEMDVSKLTDKPVGRLPIETRTIALERVSDVAGRIKAAIDDGDKVYWVCPLVEENEELDFTAAVERERTLAALLGRERVALVHGQMAPAEKDEAMRRFQTGDARVLVATTVIEVGVDVANATIMVIEHAERFGLSQLHQLRGRVGRGSKRSTCLLLYKSPLSEVSRARLQVMKDTQDGFVIAEEDLRLRGEGDLLGTRQSGMPGFRVANLAIHADLLETARDDARLILARDPDLKSERGAALRRLLYLFDRDEAIRLLRAG
ncbi:MAG: ATP-dependent DNA helicase RecG [Rhizobiales bacterium]|nr:ATP-dependent DNA helicase RecG [Hyphomicrobiales bacterium]